MEKTLAQRLQEFINFKPTPPTSQPITPEMDRIISSRVCDLSLSDLILAVDHRLKQKEL